MNDCDSVYEVFCEEITNNEIGTYITYGVRDVTGIYVVHDVSISYDRVVEIVKILNRNQLSVIHLDDVINDMLE